MPVLLSQINYRNFQIDGDTTGEELPVLLKTGEYRYVRRLGCMVKGEGVYGVTIMGVPKVVR